MNILWQMLANPEYYFYGVTIKKDPSKAAELVYSEPEDTLQEPYVEESAQEEALILLFSTKEGAEKHAAFLIREWKIDRSTLGLVGGPLAAIFKAVDLMNERVLRVKGRSVRAEVYHMDDDDCVEYEIIYSNWIVKH